MKIPTETAKPKELDFNEKFQYAHHLLENSLKNIFITGKAGTGKSTLLKYFREHTPKNIVVLAPTGVAAINIQGQTIHSFFGFKPDITPDSVSSLKVTKSKRQLYQKLDAIVIDEVSMVRADMLDCIDAFLKVHGKNKLAPFGGIQMIFFGDLYQLPPVVAFRDREVLKEIYNKPYFFHSKAYDALDLEIIELDKIYRQKDEDFINLLGLVRNRSVTDEYLRVLNNRVDPQFKPTGDDFYIYLTTTNALADNINQEYLNEIDEESFRSNGEITGQFDLKHLPTQQSLEVKAGSQVMLLNNDVYGRWVNGSIGKVAFIDDETGSIEVELTDGQSVDVRPYTWEMFQFVYDEETATIESESIGSFIQYPLRLAWAITIHKSQGKTFEKVILDIGDGAFAHGQIYVALSRCTSLEGLILKKPISRKDIRLDRSVVDFMESVLK